MDALSAVRDYIAKGLYRDAHLALRRAETLVQDSIEFRVWQAEVLQRLGQTETAAKLAASTIKKSLVSRSQRSRCELVLGQIAWEGGSTSVAVEHLARAAKDAEASNNLEIFCWAKLKTLVVAADGFDRGAVESLLPQTREAVLKAGIPGLASALHVGIAELEAKRGAFHSGKKHLVTALALLTSHPNCAIEGQAENAFSAISFLEANSAEGLAHAKRALVLAQTSGDVLLLGACHGNLANLLFLTGDYDASAESFTRAISFLPAEGHRAAAARDGLARVLLAQGRFDESAKLLAMNEDATKNVADGYLYVQRHSKLTKVRHLIETGRLEDALRLSEEVLHIAERTSDRLLNDASVCCRAELYGRLASMDRMFETTNVISGQAQPLVLELFANLEKARAFSDDGIEPSHVARARRILLALPNAPALSELSACFAGHNTRTISPGPDPKAAVQSASALLVQAGRPELLARELIELIATSGCAAGAVATATREDGTTSTIASVGIAPAAPGEEHAAPDGRGAPSVERIPVGTAGGTTFDIVVQPCPDAASRVTLQSIRTLLATVHDLERARVEREERVTLWPIDDIPLESGQAIVNGEMAKLVGYAKRIATSTASVLITGESGTGKEVLARAIHTFSPRAQKPFVPFNCAAVPPDLLESQLFGYRRGAFTGADRDSPGMIRSAAGGTLFLDEVGELSADLQPKLLRFLESGEISPLGSPAPVTVDVRIVAATNANLEQAMRTRRFRDDLFYRLNVVPLHIPPLRERRDEIPVFAVTFLMRASADYRKGQLRFAEEAMEHLVLYPWPGNIRELQNEVRRVAAMAEPDTIIGAEQLSDTIRQAIRDARPSGVPGVDLYVRLTDKLTSTLARVEREMISSALRRHGGRLEAAARALGISRKGLYLKRQRLGI